MKSRAFTKTKNPILRYARLGLLVVTTAISACTHQVPVSATAPPPKTEKLPLIVGAYFSPAFRDYRHTEGQYGDGWSFPLGPASVDLFEATFANMFERTLPMPARPPYGPTGPQVAAVIEPRFEAFRFDIPFLKTSTYTAAVTYRFVLQTPGGDTIASWTVTGNGARRGRFGFEFSRWPGEAASLAMSDAARKFIDGFDRVPEVRQWMQRSGPRISEGSRPGPHEGNAGRAGR